MRTVTRDFALLPGSYCHSLLVSWYRYHVVERVVAPPEMTEEGSGLSKRAKVHASTYFSRKLTSRAR